MWCRDIRVTTENAGDFIEVTRASFESFKRENENLARSATRRIQGIRTLERPAAVDAGGLDLDWEAGDHFPSLYWTSADGAKLSVRLDPHLRTRSLTSIEKIAPNPGRSVFAILARGSQSKSGVLLTLDSKTGLSTERATDVYDAVWLTENQLIYTNESKLRPYAAQLLDIRVGERQPVVSAASDGESVTLTRSRDGRHIFVHVGDPQRGKILIIRSGANQLPELSFDAHFATTKIESLSGHLYVLSHDRSPFGEVSRFPEEGSPPGEVIASGTRYRPIVGLGTDGSNNVVWMTSTGTSHLVTLFNTESAEQRTINPRSPVAVVRQAPISSSSGAPPLLTESFLMAPAPLDTTALAEGTAPSTLPASAVCPECKEEALAIPTSDGQEVPVSIVRPPKTAGMLLMVYGSYGTSMPASYSPYIISLLKSGVGIAIAHVRGGGELGAAWHEAGRAANKDKSIEDLIAVARELSVRGYTTPRNLLVEGRSAGGWLAAAAVLARPELFRGLILDAPLLDLESAVLSPDLPLHAREAHEWGRDPIMLKRLSPLNLIGDFYPVNTFIALPLKDTLIPPLGALEWVRRIRCTASEGTLIIVDPRLHDHSGSDNRSEVDEESALKEAFILATLL